MWHSGCESAVGNGEGYEVQSQTPQVFPASGATFPVCFAWTPRPFFDPSIAARLFDAFKQSAPSG